MAAVFVMRYHYIITYVETTALLTVGDETVVLAEITPADIIGAWSFGDGNNVLYMLFNGDMLILAYPDQPDQLFGYIRQH